MIISRTPYRISFFGGGTDYPNYYLKYGGKVLGAAINKYCYLNVRYLPPFFEYKHRIVYSRQESIIELGDIQHPSARETLKYLEIDKGVSINHDGDIPARSGMGSSSAFTVGLLNSIYALQGKRIAKSELANKAIYIEQQLIKENVGSQDQTFAANGGLNIIEFLPSGRIVVNPVIMDSERINEFENQIMLFFTGISRFSSDIAGDQIRNTAKNKNNLAYMKELVDKALSILVSPARDLCDFGKLLNETWELKKKLSNKIANPEINKMYNDAMEAGAVGGKLLGAGGGGFLMFFVKPENQRNVKKALSNYLNIPFKFDFDGSKIIVYEPNYRGKYND